MSISPKVVVTGQGPLRDGVDYALHDAAYFCNISLAREIILKDPLAAQNLSPCNDTVLHCCARGGRVNSHKMAQILLESLPSDSVREDIVNKLDSSDKSALHYAVGASNTRLVEFLLNTGFIDSEQGCKPQKYSLTHLAVKKKGATILKLLIEHGFPASNYEEDQTPLHLCVSQPESTKTVECVRVLVEKYTPDEVNSRRRPHDAEDATDTNAVNLPRTKESDDQKTALHLVAESCSPLLLGALLEHEDLYLLSYVSKTDQRTPLHLVVKSCEKNNSVECLRMLMIAGTTQENSAYRALFSDQFAATNEESCPLDLAFEIGATKMVETIITTLKDRRHWMDDTAAPDKNKKYLSQLYDSAPAALPPLMSQCLTLSGDGSKVHADFSVIRGYLPTSTTSSTNNSDADIETRYIFKVLEHPNKNTQKDILLHPLVQLFLERKQRKLNLLIGASIFLQASWLILYTNIVGSKYDTYNSTLCQRNESSSIFTGDCVLDSPTSSGFGVVIAFFLILTVLLNLKEVVQVMNDGCKYFYDGLNWLQIINFFVAIIVGIVGLFTKPPLPFLVLAAFGFLIGCILFLRGFGTFRCGIFIFAMAKVIQTTAGLVIICVPILIGFRQHLKILLPDLKRLENVEGVTKVLVVMTGEYEYNEIFKENDPSIFFDAFGKIGFVVFVIIGIALLNTLTSLAVDDISIIKKEALFRLSETRLKQIHHWEMFVARVQKFPWLNWNLSLLNSESDEWKIDENSPTTVILTKDKFISLLGDTIEMDDLIRK